MSEHINYRDFITANLAICHGQPCFKETRIMVYLVLEQLETGESVDQILQAYPSLTPEHIQAALHLAAETLQSSHSLPSSHAA